MGLRIASLMGVMLGEALRDHRGPALEIKRTPWDEEDWLGFGRELNCWAPSRRNRRTTPNEYPKSKATKRRRARNRMAAKSRRRNRI